MKVRQPLMAESAADRLQESATVLQEILSAPNQSIPQSLLDDAHCVVVVPGVKKAAFIVGAKYGRGFAICRQDTHSGWAAPAAIRMEGGSFGFQIGVSETDVVMLVISEKQRSDGSCDQVLHYGEKRVFQIKKILFPIDFSEACLGASRYVEAYTGRFQAELTLLHVVDNSAYRTWGTSAYWGMSGSDVGREGVKWAREEMGKFLTEELKHFDVKREVLEGDAGHQIVAAGRRSGADLIMMPTHGLSVFRRYIVGSMTAKVLHDSECYLDWNSYGIRSAAGRDSVPKGPMRGRRWPAE